MGKLEAGLAVTFPDRIVLGWSEGTLRPTYSTVTIGYRDITAVNPFALTAKLSTTPAAEILTSTDRYVFTFTNHPDCRADLEWWRNILVKRLTTHVPVFDRVKVLRWEEADQGVVASAQTGSTASAPAAPVSPSLPAAGWYANPAGDGLRWWDGMTWTDATADRP